MIDWKRERDRVDLARVATDLLGKPPGRRGEGGRKLWWCCPLHNDLNPSFVVVPGETSWKCWGCGETGDAAGLLMRLERLTFPEAVAKLLGGPIAPTTYRPRPRPAAAPQGHQPPTGLPAAEAVALVESAETRLWSADGVEALAYLTGERHLAPETIRAARLGWSPCVEIPTRDGTTFRTAGWIIPWHEAGRLALVNVRRPAGSKPRYLQAFRDQPAAYPGAAVAIGRPLVVVEGELDALLLGQELAEVATVVTLGSASGRPTPELFTGFAGARPWFVATDGDDAGDRAAEHWPARARRVRPPGESKDWTEARQRGVDLRRWWADRFAGVEPTSAASEPDHGDAYEGDLPPGPTLLTGSYEDPAPFDWASAEPLPWGDLAPQCWGPAVGAPEPGIDVPANSWQWAVANSPPDRWSAWHDLADRLTPPGADADAIRAAQRRAYDELAGSAEASGEVASSPNSPEASATPDYPRLPASPAEPVGDDAPTAPKPEGPGDGPPTIEGFELLSEDEWPAFAFDASLSITVEACRASAEHDRATREAMARQPKPPKRAGRG